MSIVGLGKQDPNEVVADEAEEVIIGVDSNGGLFTKDFEGNVTNLAAEQPVIVDGNRSVIESLDDLTAFTITDSVLVELGNTFLSRLVYATPLVNLSTTFRLQDSWVNNGNGQVTAIIIPQTGDFSITAGDTGQRFIVNNNNPDPQNVVNCAHNKQYIIVKLDNDNDFIHVYEQNPRLTPLHRVNKNFQLLNVDIATDIIIETGTEDGTVNLPHHTHKVLGSSIYVTNTTEDPLTIPNVQVAVDHVRSVTLNRGDTARFIAHELGYGISIGGGDSTLVQGFALSFLERFNFNRSNVLSGAPNLSLGLAHLNHRNYLSVDPDSVDGGTIITLNESFFLNDFTQGDALELIVPQNRTFRLEISAALDVFLNDNEAAPLGGGPSIIFMEANTRYFIVKEQGNNDVTVRSFEYLTLPNDPQEVTSEENLLITQEREVIVYTGAGDVIFSLATHENFILGQVVKIVNSSVHTVSISPFRQADTSTGGVDLPRGKEIELTATPEGFALKEIGEDGGGSGIDMSRGQVLSDYGDLDVINILPVQESFELADFVNKRNYVSPRSATTLFLLTEAFINSSLATNDVIEIVIPQAGDFAFRSDFALNIHLNNNLLPKTASGFQVLELVNSHRYFLRHFGNTSDIYIYQVSASVVPREVVVSNDTGNITLDQSTEVYMNNGLAPQITIPEHDRLPLGKTIKIIRTRSGDRGLFNILNVRHADGVVSNITVESAEAVELTATPTGYSLDGSSVTPTEDDRSLGQLLSNFGDFRTKHVVPLQEAVTLTGLINQRNYLSRRTSGFTFLLLTPEFLRDDIGEDDAIEVIIPQAGEFAIRADHSLDVYVDNVLVEGDPNQAFNVIDLVNSSRYFIRRFASDTVVFVYRVSPTLYDEEVISDNRLGVITLDQSTEIYINNGAVVNITLPNHLDLPLGKSVTIIRRSVGGDNLFSIRSVTTPSGNVVDYQVPSGDIIQFKATETGYAVITGTGGGAAGIVDTSLTGIINRYSNFERSFVTVRGGPQQITNAEINHRVFLRAGDSEDEQIYNISADTIANELNGFNAIELNIPQEGNYTLRVEDGVSVILNNILTARSDVELLNDSRYFITRFSTVDNLYVYRALPSLEAIVERTSGGNVGLLPNADILRMTGSGTATLPYYKEVPLSKRIIVMNFAADSHPTVSVDLINLDNSGQNVVIASYVIEDRRAIEFIATESGWVPTAGIGDQSLLDTSAERVLAEFGRFNQGNEIVPALTGNTHLTTDMISRINFFRVARASLTLQSVDYSNVGIVVTAAFVRDNLENKAIEFVIPQILPFTMVFETALQVFFDNTEITQINSAGLKTISLQNSKRYFITRFGAASAVYVYTFDVDYAPRIVSSRLDVGAVVPEETDTHIHTSPNRPILSDHRVFPLGKRLVFTNATNSPTLLHYKPQNMNEVTAVFVQTAESVVFTVTAGGWAHTIISTMFANAVDLFNRQLQSIQTSLQRHNNSNRGFELVTPDVIGVVQVIDRGSINELTAQNIDTVRNTLANETNRINVAGLRSTTIQLILACLRYQQIYTVTIDLITL